VAALAAELRARHPPLYPRGWEMAASGAGW